MEDKTLEIVLETLAKEIRLLRAELLVKEYDIKKLQRENSHLRARVYGKEEGEANESI